MRSYAKNPLIRKFFSFILVVAMVLSLTSDYHYGFAFNDTHNNIRKMSESLNDTMNKEEKVTPKAVTGSAIVGAKVVSGSAIGKNQTTNTEELNIDVSSVYYNKQDGPKTDVDLTSKLVDLTSQNGSINHYIHMSIDFDIVNSDPSTRNIKPGDYFDIPCPNAFEFNMMNSQDSIYDQTNTIVVAKYELIDEGSQQVLRVRFTDVIGEDANDGAGYWDIRCKLEVTYLMRKKNLSSEPQEFLFVLQNAEDGLLFKLPSASSLPPKGFTKSGLYDKETKTIDWTITIGEDEKGSALDGFVLEDVIDSSIGGFVSMSSEEMGNISITTVDDEILTSIKDIGEVDGCTVTTGTGENTGKDILKYKFPDGTVTPQIVHIKTYLKKENFTGVDLTTLQVENNAYCYDINHEESTKQTVKSKVNVPRNYITKTGLQTSATRVQWTIKVNSCRDRILSAMLSDELDAKYKLIANSLKINGYSINIYDSITSVPEQAKSKNYAVYAGSKLDIYYVGNFTTESTVVFETERLSNTEQDAFVQNTVQLKCKVPTFEQDDNFQTDASSMAQVNLRSVYLRITANFNYKTGILTWKYHPTISGVEENYKKIKIFCNEFIKEADNQNEKLQLQVFKEGSVKFYYVDTANNKYTLIENAEETLGVTYHYDYGLHQLIVEFEDSDKVPMSKLNEIAVEYQCSTKTYGNNIGKQYHNYGVLNLYFTEDSDPVVATDQRFTTINNNILSKSATAVYDRKEKSVVVNYRITLNSSDTNKLMDMGNIRCVDDLTKLITYVQPMKPANASVQRTVNSGDWWELVPEKSTIYYQKTKKTVTLDTLGYTRDSKKIDEQFDNLDNRIIINLTIKLKNKELLNKEVKLWTENSVELYGGNVIGNPLVAKNNVSLASGIIKNPLITKSSGNAQVSYDSKASYIPWKVTINPLAASLDNITIVDELPNNLQVDPDSIKLYAMDGDTDTLVEGMITYGLSINSDNKAVARFKFNQAIDCPYRLEYNTDILGRTSAVVENNATLYLGEIAAGSDQASSKVHEDSIAYLGTRATLNLKLRDFKEPMKPLNNACYGLFADEECTMPLRIGVTSNIDGEDSGIIQFRGLTWGTSYYIKEISPADGYKLKTDCATNRDVIKITTSPSDAADKIKVINQVVYNDKIVNCTETGNILIRKYGKTSTGVEMPLKNVEFKLIYRLFNGNYTAVNTSGTNGNYTFSDYASNIGENDEYTLVTDENGYISVKDVPWGDYYFVEVKEKEGYIKNKDKFYLEIKKNADEEYVPVFGEGFESVEKLSGNDVGKIINRPTELKITFIDERSTKGNVEFGYGSLKNNGTIDVLDLNGEKVLDPSDQHYNIVSNCTSNSEGSSFIISGLNQGDYQLWKINPEISDLITDITTVEYDENGEITKTQHNLSVGKDDGNKPIYQRRDDYSVDTILKDTKVHLTDHSEIIVTIAPFRAKAQLWLYSSSTEFTSPKLGIGNTHFDIYQYASGRTASDIPDVSVDIPLLQNLTNSASGLLSLDGTSLEEGFPIGEYYIMETVPNSKYSMRDLNYYSFSINNDTKSNDVLTGILYNDPNDVNLLVKKVDEVNPNMGIEGTKFRLTKIKDKNGVILSGVDKVTVERLTMKKNETVTYNSVEGLEKEYTIQEDGEVFFTGLSLGTYQIEEIASNLYYKNSTSFVGTFEVTATDMNSTIKFNKENLDHHKNNMTCVKGNICTKGVTNKRIDTASVTFKKVDADTDTELKNVVYDLYQLQKDVYDQNVYVKVMQGLKTGQKYNFDNSNPNVDATSSGASESNGSLIVENFPGTAWGKYRLVETKPANGYVQTNDYTKQTFIIGRILNDEGEIIEQPTPDGVEKSTKVDLGTFTNGHTELKVIVMGNKEDIILSSDSPEQVVQSNVKLYIQKLENYKSENSIDKSKYMTEWTSTSSPTRINGDSENELTSGGKYVVAVSQTKAGYLPGKEIPFTIAQQSDILPGGTLAVGGEIVTFNTIELLEGVGDASTFRDLSSGTYLSTGLIEVIIPSIDVKFDSIFDDTNESLAGTTVDVYKSSCLDASGNLLSGVTSEFKITYSTAGPRTAIAKLEADQSYIAIQTTTPSGYVVITPNEFYVDANGKVYDKTKTELISDALLIIKNTVVRGHVKLTKLTSDSRKMGNVEFDLYRTFDSLGVIDSDKDIKITEGIVTDSNGQWTSIGSSLLDAQSGKPLSKGLPVGYYYFKEKVSDGSHHINRDLTTYQLGKEIFKVDIDDQYVTDDDLITCTIVNQPLNSCVRLRKVDKNDATKGLIGAEFSIYKDNDGSIGDFVGSFVTKLKGTVIDYVDEDNNSKQYVISADGEGCYFGLPEGNYIIKETKQPTAYILDAYQKSFTMSDNLYTEVNGSYLDLGNVSNQKTNIKVVYKNKSNEVVSDVEYHIINTDTSVPIVNNTSTTLPQEYAQVFEIGKNYTVVTDSVPEQYMVSSNVEFGLGVSGVLIIGGVNITNQTIVIVLDDYVVPSVTPGPSASESPEPSASESPEPSASVAPEPSTSESPEPSASESPKPSASESPEPSASVVPIPSASVALEPSASAYPVTSPSAEPEVIPSEVPIVTGGEESPSTTSGEIPVASGTIGPKPTSSIPTNIPSDTPVETLRPSSSPIHTKDPHTTYEIVASETPVKPADTTVPPKTTEEEKKHGGKEKTDNRNPQSEEGKTNSGSDGKGNESDAHSKDDNQKNHNQEANENKHHGIVKTGDHNNLFVYLGISILSIFIFIIVTLMRRKERR